MRHKLYQDYVTMGGMRPLKDFNSNDEIRQAMDDLHKFSRLERARLRRYFRRHNLSRDHGSRWRLSDLPDGAKELLDAGET